MTFERPNKEALEAFDQSVDDATHSLVDHFAWMGLPEGDQLSDLMVQINDAISNVMRGWL